MGSSNKKFLAPTAVPAGKSTGNVYRPTEIFKQGKGKGGGVGEHQPQARTLLQSAVSKCKIKNTNKQKAVSQLQRPPSTFAKKRKKEREKEGRKEREKERKKNSQKHHTHKTWGEIAAPNFSPRKSPDSLLFSGSGNCLNAI